MNSDALSDIGCQLGNGKLILIFSAQRSGTRALGKDLRDSMVDCSFDGELFGGFTPKSTRKFLESRFPMLTEIFGPYSWNEPISCEIEAMNRKSIMSDHAIEVVDNLLRSRSGCTIIKVFMNHLERQVLEELLETFQPHIIILRRHMLFTLMSSLKARRISGFVNVDTTNVTFQLNEVDVCSYVTQLDEWFDWAFEATRRASCRTLAVSYSEVVEDGLGVELVDFLSEGGLTSMQEAPGCDLAPTKVQDRRTDSSVLHLVQAIRNLNEETLSSLLRLPGPQ